MTPAAGDFDGVRVAVFGGTGGIGAATVALLAERGADVLAVGRTATADGVRCNVTDDNDISRAFEEINSRLGGLDVLVNAAGRGSPAPFVETSRHDWATLLDLNVVSMARTIAVALPLLFRSSHAAVVNVSSILAAVGVADRAVYSASKAAVAALTRSLAADHAADGIRFNAVLPSTTETAWVDQLVSSSEDPDATRRALLARQPNARLVRPQEVADAIAYLANPRSGSTTGVLLPVDGGVAAIRAS